MKIHGALGNFGNGLKMGVGFTTGSVIIGLGVAALGGLLGLGARKEDESDDLGQLPEHEFRKGVVAIDEDLETRQIDGRLGFRVAKSMKRKLFMFMPPPVEAAYSVFGDAQDDVGDFAPWSEFPSTGL